MEEIVEKNKKSNLIEEYTFENFVVGNANSFAHAASLIVANNDIKAYNPLFIYGGIGTGKTHLLHAIGNRIYSNSPNAKILYISTEKFKNNLIKAILSNELNDFRDKYSDIDVLLIDDVQLLSGKERVQEELLYIFDSLYNDNKQIVIASSCSPKDLFLESERLRSRFSWGLLADIASPLDYKTRLAILNNVSYSKDIDDEILSLIASNSKLNIGEMKGLVNTAKLYKELLNSTTIKEKIEMLIDDITTN